MPASPRKKFNKQWLTIAAGLICFVWLAYALQLRLTGTAFRPDIPWSEALGDGALNTLVGVFIAAVALCLARWLPVDNGKWKTNSLLHLAIAPVVMTACATLSIGLGDLFTDYLGISVYRGPSPGAPTQWRTPSPNGGPPGGARPPAWSPNSPGTNRFGGAPSWGGGKPPWGDGPPPWGNGKPPWGDGPPPGGGRGGPPPWITDQADPPTETTNSSTGPPPPDGSSGPSSPAYQREFGLVLKHTLGRRGLQYLLGYFVILGFAHSWTYHRRSAERSIRATHLQASLTEAKLQALKMQLNPHFLFNSLHAISTLIHKDPPAADEMLTLLADLLRASLNESATHEVPLVEEIDFVRRYLAIEQIRFGDRLLSHLQIDPEAKDAWVPLLILQPLVENAFHHGLAKRAAAGRVSIRASREGDRLKLSVLDDGPKISDEAIAGIAYGVGLSNIRDRLMALYGEDHEIRIRPGMEFGVQVTLVLPFHEAPVFSSPEDVSGNTVTHNTGRRRASCH